MARERNSHLLTFDASLHSGFDIGNHESGPDILQLGTRRPSFGGIALFFRDQKAWYSVDDPVGFKYYLKCYFMMYSIYPGDHSP
jgi:hypothetical protein